MSDEFNSEDGSKTSDASPVSQVRAHVPAVEAILGHPFKALDNGFVRVVDYMGDDGAVVQAARVSYGVGTKRVRDDRSLIRYLMRHGHTTPFEMCEIKLHIRVPMDTWRQWIRHRTASVNEYSTRYSVAIDSAQRTKPDEWRKQSVDNRQGSSGELPREEGMRLSLAEEEFQSRSRAIYEDRIGIGIAREQARKDLPLSTYTEAYWKIDLHNLLHFLQLRMHEHAQAEIRTYANLIGNEIVSKWTPFVWEAFLDYRANALQLSNVETKIVAALTTGDLETAQNIAAQYGLLRRTPDGSLKENRERAELELKLASLGLKPSWN